MIAVRRSGVWCVTYKGVTLQGTAFKQVVSAIIRQVDGGIA